MPIITVEFIKDVVATPEQKRELIVRLTDTFVDILGDVVRPFVYTIIEETPQMEWGIAGVPMPDLAYLTGDAHAKVIARSNELMRAAIAQPQSRTPPARPDGARAASGEALDDTGAAQRRRLFARWFEDLWTMVATPQQKHELVMRLTNTFVESLSDVVRPYVYALIGETPPRGGGDEARVIDRSNELVRSAIAQIELQVASAQGAASPGAEPSGGPVRAADETADKAWRGEK
jgi:4-oxalocrotonate tautomerase